MASSTELTPDLVAALKIPKFVRVPKGQPKPARVIPEDVALDGELVVKFVSQVLIPTPHYSGSNAKALGAIGTPGNIFGTANPDQKHGKCLGAAFGRFWYAQ